jgi:two-component system, OmpR family, alkaline phosphatase synthesis response regulator PhoP
MSNGKILVVDDEIHILRVVAIKLKNNGFDVLTASDGKLGFETALEHKPDVIVSDYQMPNMTGIEMVKKLRQEKETSEIPVIMLTARGFAIEELEKVSLNIAEFLSKPFSPKELLNTIENILAQCAVQ